MNDNVFFTVIAVAFLGAGCRAEYPSDAATEPQHASPSSPFVPSATQEPSAPPGVVGADMRDTARLVHITLDLQRKSMPIGNQAHASLLTFNDAIPGPLLRVRAGDTVEITFKNHVSNQRAHALDFHALTGPGGGALASYTESGRRSVFRFKALNPGLFFYGPAAAPIPELLSQGMVGLMLVEGTGESRFGKRSAVDHEYMVVQNEYYLKPPKGRGAEWLDDPAARARRQPSHVVFNGADGSLMGGNAMRAKVGDSVRLFVGNAGPIEPLSLRIVGQVLDRVYYGGSDEYRDNLSSVWLGPGETAVVEFRSVVPGRYLLINQYANNAFERGTVASLEVEGLADEGIVSGQIEEHPYDGEDPPPPPSKAAPSTDEALVDVAAPSAPNFMEAGNAVYTTACAACHQADGKGLPGFFPPLASSDYLMEDKPRSIRVVLEGLQGPIMVNGQQYNSVMAPLAHLSDEDIANVLSFVRASWGNDGDAVLPEEVKKIRAQLKSQRNQ